MPSVKRNGPGSAAHLSGLIINPDDSDLRTDFTLEHNFMYLNCEVGQTPVTALLDSGSSINIISKQFFEAVPDSCKWDYLPSEDQIIMADSGSVGVDGTAQIQFCTAGSKASYKVPVYILKNTSHPFILGINYMKENGIVLDFSKACHSVVKSTTKIVCDQSILLPPNSQTVVQGKVHKDLQIGMQGQCLGHSEMGHKGLLVSKAVVLCLPGHQVPVKILNPTADSIHINKGAYLATFKLCDNYTDIYTVKTEVKQCTHVKLQSISQSEVHSEYNFATKGTDSISSIDGAQSDIFREKFCSNFADNISKHLDGEQREELLDCLYEHKDVFVTPENPNLGLTQEVEHVIHLKPDAKSLHQRPYRLSPDKKQLLRHHLDELISQGIIVPVSADESVPITSPTVLVAKRNKPKLDPNNITPDQSLSSFRFCVDFRYLNTQTKEFRYNIPDLQELTESFAERTPKFLSTIDMSQGYFQMKISADSSRYTAFNTPFGTFKFLRLPMGLRQSPNSFQLLMDKKTQWADF